MRAPRSLLRRWLLLASLALAYAVQLICFPVNPNGPFFQHLLGIAPWLGREEARLLPGALGYLLSMGLFAWAAPALGPEPGRAANGRGAAAHSALGRARGLTIALMALAMGLLALSTVRFALSGEDALTRWLWAGSVAVWLLGAAAMAWRTPPTPDASSPLFAPRHGLALAAILAGAIWLRFWLLADIPNDLHGDMASMGLQARTILSGAAPGLFHQGWANIPMLGFYPSVIGLKFISNSILGLNFMPAVAGTLTILGLYLLAWRLFDSHRLAGLAAAALAVNIPHIHFSRLAAYMDPWPWILFAFFFLTHGLRGRKLWAFAVAGLLTGVSLFMYYSGRVILIILPLAALYLLITHWPQARRDARFLGMGALLTAGGMAVALGPSALYFLQHSDALLERSRSVFLFHEPVMTHLLGKYGVDTPAAVLWEQLKASLLMFNYSHDTSTQFGYTAPMFSAALSPLVLLGVGYSLRRWRRPGPGFTLIWLFAIIITGSALTNNAPFWPRLTGVLPAAALMAGVAIDASLKGWGLERPVLSFWQPGPAAVAVLAAALFIALVGQRNWADYTAFVGNNARAQARIGRYLDALPDDITACSFSQPYRLNERETAFLAWPHRLVDLAPDAAEEALNACPGPARVWILAADDNSQLARVQLRWPDGQLRMHRNGAERPVFLSYLIPSASANPPGPARQPAAQSSAYLPDGDTFIPDRVWLGNERSSVTRWRVGPVRVTGHALTLLVGPVAGHDAVYDYIELIDELGRVQRFEAEDAAITSGDQFASQDGLDNHWWVQTFGPFSGGRALVARKRELVPALVTTISLPNGLYDLSIGTFTGDPANGVFGLGVQSDAWEERE